MSAPDARRSRPRAGLSCGAVLAAAILSAMAPARAEESFKGKTVRIVVGTPPGGGYDNYARLVARHLGQYLPGHPTIIVTNMPGASGMNAVSWLYAQAPKDGTVIATFNKSEPFYEAIGQKGVRFKSEELTWIGSLSQAPDMISVWHAAGVKSIDDAKTKEVVLGADSGGTMTLYPALLNATLGTRFKIVTGYPGSAAVYHAIEQGEVQGVGSTPWTTWKSTRPSWVANRLIIPLVQVGLKKDPDLPDVPRLVDLAENDEQRTLFTFVSEPANIERPYAGPPALPAEILTLYRRAFGAMTQNQSFQEEAARFHLDLDPQSGEEVARIVSNIVETPKPMVARVKAIVDEGR